MNLRPCFVTGSSFRILDDPVTNVYLLIDYGDFIEGTSNTDNPYVQLLSMTNPAEAHADFVATRLGGKDNSGSNPKSSPGPSPSPGQGSKAKGLFEKYRIPILAGAAAIGALLLLTTAFYLFRSRRPAYRPIVDPAPAGSMQMYTVAGYNAGAQPAPDYNNYNNYAPYADPWNRRS